MATDSDVSRSNSTTSSTHDEASSHTDSDNESQTSDHPHPKGSADISSRSSILLANDPFASNESRILFDAIDKLRSHGAGQVLNLPQLVIVGKQSVGKSSLLEGLTDIPFPVEAGLCTRFATRVISRRTAPGTPNMISVSIEDGDEDLFGDSKNGAQTGYLEPPEDQNSMTAEYFRELMKKASIAMGISGSEKGSPKSFSSKVLKIELSGPGRSHFGILDLPGIFDNETGPITPEEREGVDRMVIAYMKRKENIIVFVADASQDLATERIVKLALAHADNDRIVGVFTKCDRTQDPQSIVSIVQRSEATTGKTLRHGWFVVRNRGTMDDRSSFDRQKAERSTFSKEPWINTEERRRGTTNLKLYLSSLLSRSIREGFTEMQKSVQNRLTQERKALKALGEPRTETEQQRAYISDIALRFQTLAEYALHDPQNLPSVEMKLRGKADRAKEEFAEILRHHGHLYDFFPISETEVTPKVSNQQSKGSTLYDEIRTQIRDNKGQELQGMVNPAVLKPLFRQQSSKWPAIAEQHLENLANLTEKVVLRILQFVCKELGVAEYIHAELELKLLKFIQDARSIAKTKLDDFRSEEHSLPLQTNNPAFSENVKNAQFLRFKAALERYASKNTNQKFILTLLDAPANITGIPAFWRNWTIISPETLADLFEEMHSHTKKNTEDEIHDLLKAYYEVVREDYITYINRHVAEPFLQDKKGPVKGLCTTYVNELTKEEVEELGAEQGKTVNDRITHIDNIERLENADKIATDAYKRTKALA